MKSILPIVVILSILLSTIVEAGTLSFSSSTTGTVSNTDIVNLCSCTTSTANDYIFCGSFTSGYAFRLIASGSTLSYSMRTASEYGNRLRSCSVHNGYQTLYCLEGYSKTIRVFMMSDLALATTLANLPFTSGATSLDPLGTVLVVGGYLYVTQDSSSDKNNHIMRVTINNHNIITYKDNLKVDTGASTLQYMRGQTTSVGYLFVHFYHAIVRFKLTDFTLTGGKDTPEDGSHINSIASTSTHVYAAHIASRVVTKWTVNPFTFVSSVTVTTSGTIGSRTLRAISIHPNERSAAVSAYKLAIGSKVIAVDLTSFTATDEESFAAHFNFVWFDNGAKIATGRYNQDEMKWWGWENYPTTTATTTTSTTTTTDPTTTTTTTDTSTTTSSTTTSTTTKTSTTTSSSTTTDTSTTTSSTTTTPTTTTSSTSTTTDTSTSTTTPTTTTSSTTTPTSSTTTSSTTIATETSPTSSTTSSTFSTAEPQPPSTTTTSSTTSTPTTSSSTTTTTSTSTSTSTTPEPTTPQPQQQEKSRTRELTPTVFVSPVIDTKIQLDTTLSKEASTLVTLANIANAIGGSTAGGALAMRQAVLISLSTCGAFTLDELDVATNPTRIEIGQNDYRYWMGVVVGDSVILIGLVLLAVIYVFVRVKCCSSSSSSSNSDDDHQQEEMSERLLNKNHHSTNSNSNGTDSETSMILSGDKKSSSSSSSFLIDSLLAGDSSLRQEQSTTTKLSVSNDDDDDKKSEEDKENNSSSSSGDTRTASEHVNSCIEKICTIWIIFSSPLLVGAVASLMYSADHHGLAVNFPLGIVMSVLPFVFPLWIFRRVHVSEPGGIYGRVIGLKLVNPSSSTGIENENENDGDQEDPLKEYVVLNWLFGSVSGNDWMKREHQQQQPKDDDDDVLIQLDENDDDVVQDKSQQQQKEKCLMTPDQQKQEADLLLGRWAFLFDYTDSQLFLALEYSCGFLICILAGLGQNPNWELLHCRILVVILFVCHFPPTLFLWIRFPILTRVDGFVAHFLWSGNFVISLLIVLAFFGVGDQEKLQNGMDWMSVILGTVSMVAGIVELLRLAFFSYLNKKKRLLAESKKKKKKKNNSQDDKKNSSESNNNIDNLFSDLLASSPSKGQRQDFQIDWHDLIDEEDKNKKKKDIDLDHILERFMEDADVDHHPVDDDDAFSGLDNDTNNVAGGEADEDIDLQEFLNEDGNGVTNYYDLDENGNDQEQSLDDAIREFANDDDDEETNRKLAVQRNSELEQRRRELKKSLGNTKQS